MNQSVTKCCARCYVTVPSYTIILFCPFFGVFSFFSISACFFFSMFGHGPRFGCTELFHVYMNMNVYFLCFIFYSILIFFFFVIFIIGWTRHLGSRAMLLLVDVLMLVHKCFCRFVLCPFRIRPANAIGSIENILGFMCIVQWFYTFSCTTIIYISICPFLAIASKFHCLSFMFTLLCCTSPHHSVLLFLFNKLIHRNDFDDFFMGLWLEYIYNSIWFTRDFDWKFNMAINYRWHQMPTVVTH